jgi:hypothetical protein
MNAFIAIAACAILVYIVYAYNKSRTDNLRQRYTYGTRRKRYALHGRRCRDISACGLSSSSTRRGTYRLLSQDRLTASDLLPKDASNELWAQANPAG